MLELQRKEKVAILFIAHGIAVVERVSHRVAVTYSGEIVETGPAEGSVAKVPSQTLRQN